jgi:DNA adenine methylase
MSPLRETLLDTKGVAELLGCTVQHVRWLFRKGIVPAIKLGRDWFTYREDVEPYIAERALAARQRQLEIPGEPSVTTTMVPTERADGPVNGVNVAQVPQLSPLRYPGGKTWLIPYVRRWLQREGGPETELLEPFAGGGIVSLTAVFEGLVERATLVELDRDVASVWLSMLNGHGPWLAECIAKFKPTPESVRRVLANRDRSPEHRAFATVVRNRVSRGGILAPGAGFVKLGENGKGLASRWYPATLSRRVLRIAEHRDRLTFLQSDGMEVLREWSPRPRVIYFIDPPYTVAARRLYQHWELDHDRLFAMAARLKGDFLMTYDDAEEIRALADKHGLTSRTIAMKTTHHWQKSELLIGRRLDWLGG